MIRQFPSDKNIILRQAQSDLRNELCSEIVNITISNYLAWDNPLGLVDDFVQLIQKKNSSHLHLLHPFYDYMAFVYRFYNQGNQLEILWDGRSHYEKFSEEWSSQLEKWVTLLGQKTTFNKLVLKSCAVPSNSQNPFVSASLLRCAQAHFEVKPIKKAGFKKIA